MARLGAMVQLAQDLALGKLGAIARNALGPRAGLGGPPGKGRDGLYFGRGIHVVQLAGVVAPLGMATSPRPRTWKRAVKGVNIAQVLCKGQ